MATTNRMLSEPRLDPRSQFCPDPRCPAKATSRSTPTRSGATAARPAVRPSPRNLSLIQHLVARVRLAWTPGRTLQIGVDGLASSVTAFWRAFRERVRTGRRGRPPYRLPEGVLLGQVVKDHSGRRLVGVVRRVVWGSPGRIHRVLRRTGTGQQINTSYIERLNATFRSRLASLVRRGRGLAHRAGTLEMGMHLVGRVYNFCTVHRSLRLSIPGGTTKWRERTPAMAARWADHVWSVQQLLSFRAHMAPHG
jgi:hypothetical protein